MDVGVVVGFQNPPAWRADWHALYRDTLMFVEHAEHLGIDEVWLTEHHFSDDGYCPSLLPVAAAIAARTSRIRIGTKLILLPLHDPLRVAEDAAVVDIISGGRLDLGLGAGYRANEFMGFGIARGERAARLAEGVQVLRLALSGEAFTHDGAFYHYRDARVSPPPIQHPVPIWLGGRSRAAMRRAARLRTHLQLADFVLESSRADMQTFAEAIEGDGGTLDGIRIATVATLVVDRDPDAAWRVALPHLLYQQNQYAGWFSEASDRASDAGRRYRTRDDLAIGNHLVGAPEEIMGRIRALHDVVPFTHFSFWGLLPGMPVPAALRSLELFAAEILPELRRLPSSNLSEVSR